MALLVYNTFTKSVYKLKQCTTIVLHDENYTSFIVSLLIYKMGVGEGGAYLRGGEVVLKFGQ